MRQFSIQQRINVLKKTLRFLTKIAIELLLVIACLWLLISRPSWFEYAQSNEQTKSTVTKVEVDALKRHVKKLSTEFVPRDYRHPANLNLVANYLKTHLSGGNNRVYFQTYQAAGEEYHNVIAEFGPANLYQQNQGDVTIIGAHYDAYSTLPGADDNASGVAALLELSRLLSQNPPKNKVMLVAFTLEEPPIYDTELMGSMIHAKLLKDNNVPIKTMISLETIGYYSNEPNSQTFPMPLLNAFYPLTGDYIGVVGNMTSNTARRLRMTINQKTPLAAYSINAPGFVTGVDFSDHRSYWNFDYDAVMVTDTAFFRNTAYHTEQDTFDRLDYDKMAAVVAGVYAFVQAEE